MNKSEGRNFIKIKKFNDNTSILRFNLLSEEQRKIGYDLKWSQAQVRCAGGNCESVLKIEKNEAGWNLKDWTPYIKRTYVSANELGRLAYLAKSIVEFFCPNCKVKEIEEKTI